MIRTPNRPKALKLATPNTTPTRKAPHCKKCKRPRAGHPRSGCPYVQDPAPTREATAEPDTQITHALNSLHITPPPPPPPGPENSNHTSDKENRAENGSRQVSRRIGAPNATRLSLSTTAGEVFERLRAGDATTPTPHPGGVSRRQSRIARIEEWQHSVAIALEESGESSDTDGSGNCSGPLVSSQSGDGASSPGSNVARRLAALGTRQANLGGSPSPSPSSGTGHPARPLVRSMSMEERESFVESLNRASDASVYVLPKVDIQDVQAAAVKLGFRTRVVMNEKDEDDLQALLVLARDQESFEWLSEKIEREDREVRRGQQARSAAFAGFMAGGAVIGAVGAWAGLAFS